ncbi:MAG: YbfB/YjiJ family MFS transporter [Rhodoferax sp.]|nr:YbfB/YjiJ family MFS transporter [Rhodoferax sp.]
MQPSLAEAPVPASVSSVRIALVLSLGAAVSLGIARFAYGLLLPPMRDDLGWTYALAGAMNTSNAAGYLLGALATPWLLQRMGAGSVLLTGSALVTVLMAISGLFTDTTVWLLLRLAAGAASALVFMTGGLLAARLGAQDPERGGLLIGLYYGGTGVGISLSALLVPAVLHTAADTAHAWAWGWAALALLCFAGTAMLRWPVQRLGALAGAVNPGGGPVESLVPMRRLAYALGAYFMFGVGYIGYMTFIIALLNEHGYSAIGITGFYTLLGLAVMASSRLWARLLDRHRDGRPLALLNALLGLATLLPALSSAWPLVFASGLVFGAVFLSVVASTTALVRHNLPDAQLASGIGAFTIVFAAGQIVGPTVVGWISDGAGGLERGLVVSALALWVGSLLAMRQRAVVLAA